MSSSTYSYSSDNNHLSKPMNGSKSSKKNKKQSSFDELNDILADDEEYHDEEPWNDSDNDEDYDEHYSSFYEDENYAAAPPKKKKYRESDANIKPLSYAMAKKEKNKQSKDKYNKRYSKYGSEILIFDDDDLGTTTESNHSSSKQIIKPKPIKIANGSSSKLKKHRDSQIEDSLTKEINDHEDDSFYAKESEIELSNPLELNKKELSLYYNKKTQDKYNEFEMNTYSSDSNDSDSEHLKTKYLGKITPAPADLDKKYNLKSDKKLKPSKTQKDNEKQRKLKKKTPKKETKNKTNKFTLKQFMSVDLGKFVKDCDYDNFDIAKAVCKYYDVKCGDTDTVTIVSDKGMGPNTAYWSKGDYNRVEKDCLGKYIMVYRACKHIEANVKVKQDIFESCVKGICMDNLGHSQLIADKLDCVFGEGCHVSLGSHDDYEVFCRYSDGYICEVELPSNDFVVAWRR